MPGPPGPSARPPRGPGSTCRSRRARPPRCPPPDRHRPAAGTTHPAPPRDPQAHPRYRPETPPDPPPRQPSSYPRRRHRPPEPPLTVPRALALIAVRTPTPGTHSRYRPEAGTGTRNRNVIPGLTPVPAPASLHRPWYRAGTPGTHPRHRSEAQDGDSVPAPASQDTLPVFPRACVNPRYLTGISGLTSGTASIPRTHPRD
ncbi:proline-rich protein HaeIII subfamily 1-like [Chiroxiphia lanceolata]|uniref:proline-rich protein HaeIII subfamily 1-like n=1 Tax=Chiroxiphia lanceolata TaxID=296741 RepID=UPI0013CE6A51|nr:proline-rich protein HaeIII subfamily 1-like [Chiroxiphia lanceolata]